MQGVQFTHSGTRYSLGYDADTYVIWDLETGPVRRFPRTDQGWAEAWTAYVALEPANVDLRGGQTPAAGPRGPGSVPGVPTGYVGYAGFWRRFFAWLIDALILGVVLAPLNIAVGPGTSSSFGGTPTVSSQ